MEFVREKEISSIKTRNSWIEVLRIICIFAIIGDHFIGQSGIATGGGFLNQLFYVFGTSLSRIGCAVFVIISSWFNVDKKFNINKILYVWFTVIFYTLIFTGVCVGFGVAKPSDFATAIIPISGSPLWFAGFYIVLMLLSPFLNSFINRANKNIVEFTLFIFFCLSPLYSTITCRNNFLSNEMFTLIFIYVLTGYIKKNNLTIKSSKAIIMFLSVWVFINILKTCNQVYIRNEILSQYLEQYRAQFHTIPALLLAYLLFFSFNGLKPFNSKSINKIASCSLGIYSFHQVPVWYPFLWSKLFRAQFHKSLIGFNNILYIVVSILTIFIVGAIIEMIRQFIFKYAFEERKYYRSLTLKINNIVNINEGTHKEKIFICFTIIVILTIIFIVSKVLNYI